jgi:hypothetical protein
MRLHDPGLKPKPLPPRPGLSDRLEYGLEWLVYIFCVRIEGKPSLSGCLSGLLMGIPMVGALLFFFWLLLHFFHV